MVVYLNKTSYVICITYYTLGTQYKTFNQE